MDAQGRAVVSDYSIRPIVHHFLNCQRSHPRDEIMRNRRHTWFWTVPDLWKDDVMEITPPIDVFSFGLLCLTVSALTRRDPTVNEH
jgi:hypothetical protein